MGEESDAEVSRFTLEAHKKLRNKLLLSGSEGTQPAVQSGFQKHTSGDSPSLS
jgi:hypothetical protein